MSPRTILLEGCDLRDPGSLFFLRLLILVLAGLQLPEALEDRALFRLK